LDFISGLNLPTRQRGWLDKLYIYGWRILPYKRLTEKKRNECFHGLTTVYTEPVLRCWNHERIRRNELGAFSRVVNLASVYHVLFWRFGCRIIWRLPFLDWRTRLCSGHFGRRFQPCRFTKTEMKQTLKIISAFSYYPTSCSFEPLPKQSK